MVNKTRGLKRVDTIAGGYIVRDASYFQFQINDLRPRKGVADFERDLIALRTSEGGQRARASGIKFGPKFKLSPYQMDEIRRRKETGASCRSLGPSQSGPI
jgi:DNA invertase Pin-like site-specific DNA recombinase